MQFKAQPCGAMNQAGNIALSPHQFDNACCGLFITHSRHPGNFFSCAQIRLLKRYRKHSKKIEIIDHPGNNPLYFKKRK
ncbi:MAG: hypothetical protein E6Z15_18120, partial [Paenibacillus macerans]|nr:hypothetical protein [Paenibacillus macerans]